MILQISAFRQTQTAKRYVGNIDWPHQTKLARSKFFLASSRENLEQPYRLRVGLGQKLSVGHVFNSNRSSIRLDNRQSLLGIEGGDEGRLQTIFSTM
jgi:hypothetical protein